MDFKMTGPEKFELVLEINDYIREWGRKNGKKAVILHPFLIGKAGVGKTSFIESWAEKRGLTYKVVILHAIPRDEVLGGGMADISEGVFRFYHADWADADVVFFDDFDKADIGRQNTLRTVLTTGEINGKPIKVKYFVFAGNPAGLLDKIQEMKDGLRGLLEHHPFMTRFVFIPFFAADGYKYLFRKYNIRDVSVPELSRVEQELLQEFKIPFDDAVRLAEYTFFAHEYLMKKYKDFDKASEVWKELFWYVNEDDLAYLLSIVEERAKEQTPHDKE